MTSDDGTCIHTLHQRFAHQMPLSVIQTAGMCHFALRFGAVYQPDNLDTVNLLTEKIWHKRDQMGALKTALCYQKAGDTAN